MSKLKTPESWAETNLENLVEFLDRLRRPISSENRKPGPYPYYGANGLQGYHNEYIFDERLLLLAEDGGHFGSKTKDIAYIVSGRTWVNNHAHVLRAKEGVDLDFLRQYLRRFDVRPWVTGATVPKLNQEKTKSLPVVVPPLGEQRRIVAKIESTQEKVKTIESSISKAEELIEKYRESLLQKAFRGDLVPQDPNDEPASKLIERIRNEPAEQSDGKKKKKDELPPIKPEEIPFEIPQSWEWVRFEEITDNLDGKRVPIKSTDRKTTKGSYPYYGASGVIDYVDDYIFEGEHLLVSEDGANLLARKYPIAFIATGKFWVNNHAHIVKALPVTSNKYLELYFESLDISRWVTGAAQPKFNQEKLNSVPIPLPPIEEQKRILAKLAKRLNHQEFLFGESEKMKSILPQFIESILSKAFSGSLVPQLLSEGTGHELLEKIKSEQSQATEGEAAMKSPTSTKKKRANK